MKIIFLGTNGWYATNLGNTTSTLINSKDFYIILDAGDGFYKIDQYINEEKPIIILLSHLHLDHIIGLHALAKFTFNQEISIFGYNGTVQGLQIILNQPFSASLSNLPLKIKIQDIEENSYDIGFGIKSKLLVHSGYSLGYSLKIDKKKITYCTDTGICPSLFELANEADLLITECSYKPGQEEWGWPHLKPEEAAEVAEKSNVKKLILTHFDASYYRTIRDRKSAELKAKRIFPNTIAATDGLEVILE